MLVESILQGGISMKPTVFLMLVFVMMFVMVAPASAGSPIVETIEVDDDVVAYDNTLCPGIVIRKHEVYTLRLTSYFDKQGNLNRIKGHVDGFDNFYNPANPDVVLSGHFVVNFEIDLLTGEIRPATGIPFHITAPGYGTVLVQAGRWVIYPDGHVAGKDSMIDPKDVAQFCSIMAGN
jgi:hypothetical protein